MTQEEFYVWLMNCDSSFPNFPEFDPEFLKNYEIAKLVLDKFGIHALSEEKQRKLNLDAVYSWLRNSRNIKLEYDIPEILELLPERIVGILVLEGSKIRALPNLRTVGEGLYLEFSCLGDIHLRNPQVQYLPILKYLPNLESVGDDLNLEGSKIRALPNLRTVGGDLELWNSKIRFLPKLDNVGGWIYTSFFMKLYWKLYFLITGRRHLARIMKSR